MNTQKKRGQREKHTALRILVWTLIALSALFAVGVISVSIYAVCVIDPALDEALFDNAGGDTVTRLYYNDPDGEPVAQLDAYLAKEWESERTAGSTKCLYTPIEQIPEHLKNAFIAIEDRHFYRHGGVDILRTGKAALNSVLHFSPRFGGSTITQQLIKNIGGEKEQTASRKLKEMLRARLLERRHTKEEILEAYLNIVPMSGNSIGVGAGSLLYFNKAPSSLSLAEAASIAAVTRAPALYAPERNSEAHLSRRNLVLAKMLEYGMIDEQEYTEAVATPLTLENGLKKEDGARSWYTETVLSDVMRDLVAKGYTESAAKALIYRGGLKIYTAVDMKAQRAAEAYFEDSQAFAVYGDGLSAAFVLLSPENGNLAAIIGNRGKKTGNMLLNHATDTLRAPGSALKPIALYAPAIDEGRITEATVFDDVPTSFSGTSPWPHNAPDVYTGLIPAAKALADSKNTVAVSLYEMLGAEHIYAVLGRLGIDTLVRREISSDGSRLTDLAPAPLALGELTHGVSLRSLVRAYLPLADGGRLHNVRSYLLVLDRNGDVLLSPEAQTEQVFKESTASVMTHMLSLAVKEGSAASLSLPETVDTAGKTGTSSGSRDRVFIGYTPYYLGGVWCGYSQGARAVGGSIHLDVFDAVMKEVHDGLPDEDMRSFQMAKGLVECRVCRDSGERCSHLCALDARGTREIIVWLPQDKVPHRTCEAHVGVWYDEIGEGVVLDAASYHGAPLKRVSLVRAPDRDFPVDIPIADAEYTWRDMGDTAPSTKDEAFFAPLLEKGHYAGKAPDGGRPFNALSKSIIGEREEKPIPLPGETRQPHGDKTAPRTKGKKPTTPSKKRREAERNPFSRLFDWFGRAE